MNMKRILFKLVLSDHTSNRYPINRRYQKSKLKI